MAATVRAVIKKALTLAEVDFNELYQAGNGQEALDVLEDNWVDLIFCDISMPEMDGEEFVKVMNEKGMIETVPVVIVSSAGSEPRMARLKDLRHAPIPQQGVWLSRVLRGYFNDHAVPGNLKRLDGFRAEVTRAWRQSLMRRSQTHRLRWSRCNKLVRKYFPSVKLAHPYPTVRFAS